MFPSLSPQKIAHISKKPFTYILEFASHQELHRVFKLLSEDPSNYPDAPREGIRRMLEEVTGKPHPRDTPLDTSRIASIRMGTTVRSTHPLSYIEMI